MKRLRKLYHRKKQSLHGRSSVFDHLILKWALGFLFGLLPLTIHGESKETAEGIKGPKKESRLWMEIEKLHPTQFCAGFKAVDENIRELQKKSPEKLRDFVKKHPLPVIKGPALASVNNINPIEHYYLIDRHHLALAYLKVSIKAVPLFILSDQSHQSSDSFAQWLLENHFVYLRDEHDQPRELSELPPSLWQLRDDPYRSLAGFAEERGAFNKTSEPYMQFQWARYYRSKISSAMVIEHFQEAIERAIAFSKQPEARSLPGYKGPSSNPFNSWLQSFYLKPSPARPSPN